MHVHLVAVKVGVVRGRHRQIQPECRVGKHLHSVTHEGHLVQRGLSIENNVVVVAQVTLYHVARLQISISGFLQGTNVEVLTIGSVDELSPRPGVRSIVHESSHLLDVLSGDGLRHSQFKCNLERDTELVELQNGVGSDDRAGRELNTLSHQVSTETSFLAS